MDDFEGPADPRFTGWHRLEYRLWKLSSTKDTKPFADHLDADIATLWDFDANVDGSRKLFELLTPALEAKDAALVAEIAAGFAAVDTSLAEYAGPDGGFRSYTALQAGDKARMQAELAGLSEKLARIPGVLGLKG